MKKLNEVDAQMRLLRKVPEIVDEWLKSHRSDTNGIFSNPYPECEINGDLGLTRSRLHGVLRFMHITTLRRYLIKDVSSHVKQIAFMDPYSSECVRLLIEFAFFRLILNWSDPSSAFAESGETESTVKPFSVKRSKLFTKLQQSLRRGTATDRNAGTE